MYAAIVTSVEPPANWSCEEQQEKRDVPVIVMKADDASTASGSMTLEGRGFHALLPHGVRPAHKTFLSEKEAWR
jgi:hypothetical protein